MNAIDRMNSNVSSFSKTDRRIYEAIRKFPESFAHESISHLSESAGFTKPALTRFAQRIGFSGYAEFQYQLAQDLEERAAVPDAETNAEVYGRLLTAVDEGLAPEVVEALVQRICASRSVFLYGSNLSALPAEELYIALQFVPGVVAVLPQLDTTPFFSPDDVLIVYSAARGDRHQALMQHLRHEGVTRPHCVLVTTNGKHALRRNFDEVIVLPTAALSEGNHSILSDTFAFLMFNDRLTAALDQRS